MTALILLALATAPELNTMFPMRAEVSVPPGNFTFIRLPLPPEVLRQSQADMSDVRLLDETGRVVPFVVRHHEEARRTTQQADLKMVSAERKLRTQPQGPPSYSEESVFELPKETSGVVTLILYTARVDFVRLATVEVLSANGSVLSSIEQSVFRLADANAERLQLTLGTLPPGARKLRVSFEGESGGFLEATALMRWDSVTTESSTLRWPVSVKPKTEGRITRVSMERPSGFVPTRLVLETTTPWFLRRMMVTSNGSVIASGFVTRKPGAPAVEVLSLDVPRTQAGSLEVVIDNQDSAPLDELQLTWVIEQPELVFSSSSKMLSLVFGGGRTQPARYDIDGQWAEPTGNAALGAPQTNPSYVPSSLLSALRNPGTPFDTKRSQFQATVKPWTGNDEVVTVTLGPGHAETMRRDFGDVRLVDQQGRQWPYVLETKVASQVIALNGPTLVDGAARYVCEPRGRLVGMTVRPAVGTGYFSRRAQVMLNENGKKPQRLWEGTLTFNPSERGEPTRLHIGLETLISEGTLELVLNQGGDGLLEGLELETELVVPSLKTVAPVGEYRVVWGDGAALPPTYDLVRARGVLDELKSATVVPGEAEPNLQYVSPSLLERSGGVTRWVFWGTLSLAVGVLTVLAVRMARDSAPSD